MFQWCVFESASNSHEAFLEHRTEFEEWAALGQGFAISEGGEFHWESLFLDCIYDDVHSLRKLVRSAGLFAPMPPSTSFGIVCRLVRSSYMD